MIYLIKTSYYDEKTCKPAFLLKIGYAKNIDDRMKTYKTHNPLVQLLDTREGDYELENELHHYFKEYAYPNQFEWFYYNERIIKEFNTYKQGDIYDNSIEKEWVIKKIKEFLTPRIIKTNYIYELLSKELTIPDEDIDCVKSLISQTIKLFRNTIESSIDKIDFSVLPNKVNINQVVLCIETNDKTISLDLPQILGRQRLDCNPWKNSANLYVVLRYKEGGKQEFIDYMNEKDKQTKNLLQAYSESSSDEIRRSLAKNYEKDARNSNYKDDYVAVNRHSGSQLVPVLNNLMRIAELRTFEIQEYDYKDRFSVFSNLGKSNLVISSKDRIDVTIWKFNHEFTTFVDKMKYLCDQKSILSNEEYNAILGLVPIEYKNYIITLGVDRIKANSYKGADCNKEFNRILLQQNSSLLRTNIQLSFTEGERYTKSEIKEKLKEVYLNSNYTATPKATDLEQWFEVKEAQWRENGKKIAGFEIIKKKGD